VGKGADVSAAINKATDVAKKSLIQFPMHNGTLTHEVLGKVGGSRILIMPAAPGTGLIAGGVVRTVLEVAGFEDALSKSIGSSNKLNTAYATLEALKGMEPASKWVTRTNGGVKEAVATPKKAAVKAE
jgi:small subunit ribosomal protein S5